MSHRTRSDSLLLAGFCAFLFVYGVLPSCATSTVFAAPLTVAVPVETDEAVALDEFGELGALDEELELGGAAVEGLLDPDEHPAASASSATAGRATAVGIADFFMIRAAFRGGSLPH